MENAVKVMNLSQLTACYCALKSIVDDHEIRITALENALDIDTDEQTLSLAGNVITLSPGVTGGGGTVDLTPFLDNTDDQILSANLVGTDLILTIEDGNTVTVPLASINTDDQTLTLAGNTATLSPGVTGGGGSLTLNVTKEPRRLIYASGRNNGVTNEYVYACGITRTAAGRYEVRFNTPHPGGTNYVPVFGQGEPSNLRDVPKVSWVTGTLNANGFDVQVTVDDNGGAADGYSDNDWGFHVEYTDFDIVTDVALS